LKLIADYHTHTLYSHGTGSVLDNAAAAKRHGLKIVGIADHGPANFFGIGIKKLSDFLQIKADVFVARRKIPGIRVLVGAEANIISTDGDIDIPPEIVEHLDYLLVGLHPFVKTTRPSDFWRLAVSNLMGKRFKQWDTTNRFYNTKAVIRAVERHPVLAVTHPGYRLNIDTKALAVACAAKGSALEINCNHQHITPEYIKIARDVGAKFLVGSDAHRPEDVGHLERGLFLIAETGLTPAEVLNAVDQADETQAAQTRRGGIDHQIAEIRRRKRAHRLQ